ncbi:PUA-like domain-containing protein [Xylaria arbuscula]|nr:PUA-like domain-containing protein [Xylaria arbuscula]
MSDIDPVVKVEPEVSELNGVLTYNSAADSPHTIKSEADGNVGIQSNGSLSLKELVAGTMDVKNEADTVTVLNMGGGSEAQKILRMAGKGRSILTLCRNSKISITAVNTKEMIKRCAEAHAYLAWLDTTVEMTPRINNGAKVDMVLAELIKPENKIPSDLVQKAESLFTKYKAENWGRDVVADEAAIQDSDGTLIESNEKPVSSEVQLPADNDFIFGIHGIMYGIIVDKTGSNRSYRIRPDLQRKSPKVYGHNGIALGAWYPLQISALFHGAHGSRIGGIAGDVTTGAWSIVVAGTYEDLDTDNGDTLYYSGSNSHDNKNPREPASASQGTKALHASYRTQNPVRVLRSGGSYTSRNQNRHLPSCGMRYDGLYRVVGSRLRLNKKGGQYEQFKLERLPDQTPLTELERNIPTPEQVNAREKL